MKCQDPSSDTIPGALTQPSPSLPLLGRVGFFLIFSGVLSPPLPWSSGLGPQAPGRALAFIPGLETSHLGAPRLLSSLSKVHPWDLFPRPSGKELLSGASRGQILAGRDSDSDGLLPHGVHPLASTLFFPQ